MLFVWDTRTALFPAEAGVRILFRIHRRDYLAEALLRISVPVTAIELEEDSGVWDGHFRLDEKDAKDLGGLIELG